jgi:hypothetical protein
LQSQDSDEERRVPTVTDVTIRGIDDEVYARFAAEAKKRGIPIGELATEAMKDLVDRAIGPSYRIADLDLLSVSRSDLESMDRPVVFADIDVLEFENDVDWTIFKDHVERINDVALVLLPKSLSKFQVLTRAKDVAAIKGSGK